jgi:hypothetical protein
MRNAWLGSSPSNATKAPAGSAASRPISEIDLRKIVLYIKQAAIRQNNRVIFYCIFERSP